MKLTNETLKSLLRYEPETGHFYWLVQRGKAHIGQRAGHVTNVDGGRWKGISIRVNQRRFWAHRLAFLYMLGALPPDQVDHINGDSLDNRWHNLRHATHAENLQNIRGTRSRSGFIGVTPRNTKKQDSWKATICLNRKQIHLGTFNSPEEASAAYLAAKRELHPYGEIAKVQ